MSQPSGSPPGSPRSNAPATPARLPQRSPEPQRSPTGSNASQSPRFGRTPRSVGESLAASPLASPPRTPLGAVRYPMGSPEPSPLASPASGRSPTNRPAHRGFLGSRPVATPLARRSTAPDGGDGDPMDEGSTFLYGTDISEARVVDDFVRFIRNFREPGTPAGERSYYLQELDKRWEEQVNHAKGIKVPIKGEHINAFEPRLYNNLVSFPTEVIPIFDREMWNISMQELSDQPEDLGTCQVQIFDLLEQDAKVMRDMNPEDIEHLVSMKGIVIRCSDLMPDMMAATFRCSKEDCKHEVEVPLSHWTIEEPRKCEGCGASHSFEIIHNDCKFADRQLLKLQETPELVPEGETPQNVMICCFDDLVDLVRPGDRVEITGIYKAAPTRPLARMKMCNSVYRTYIDAISIASDTKARADDNSDDLDQLNSDELPKLSEERDLKPELNSDEDIKINRRIRALAAEKDADGNLTIGQQLVESFAPSIYEEDEVKRGLLCQLFGGTRKPNSSAKGRTRPEINALLCGDPSTAKSQLLQFSYKLAPRGIITSGKGSSAVGLTATINKDPITRELVLESGALVLADRGLCCIDEFDKMDENARAILHEAMEQQTVSVAKAGIVCGLNARTAVLASANPRDSSYDPRKSVVDNVNLPKNLMTRFDFIWLMLDKRNRDTDRRLGEHLVALYSEQKEGDRAKKAVPMDADFFKRYVSFARRYVHPILTDQAAETLKKNYIDLRNEGSAKNVVIATPRILESMIRISESLAKMQLREEVTSKDVDEALRLIKEATYAAAVDPETGVIDMEMFISGQGAGRRKRAREMEGLLQEILAENSGGGILTVDAARAAMNEKLGEKREKLLGDGEFDQVLRTAETDGLVVRRGKQLEIRG